MDHIKTFEAFDATWAKRYRKNKNIGDVRDDVEIRIDLEAVPHVLDRQYRHGVEEKITEDEIVDLVEKSVEELTIALMQDRLNVGERFTLKDKDTNLNCVCVLEPEENNFKLIIITVIRKENFTTPTGQYVLSI